MFDLTKTLRDIEAEVEKNYHTEASPTSKVFYDIDEWDGWRFYRKALFNADLSSLIGHLKSTYLPHK